MSASALLLCLSILSRVAPVSVSRGAEKRLQKLVVVSGLADFGRDLGGATLILATTVRGAVERRRIKDKKWTINVLQKARH